MALFIFWIALAFAVSLMAKGKGLSMIGFFFLSLFLSPLIGFIVVLVSNAKSPPQQIIVNAPAAPIAVESEASKMEALEHMAVLKEKGFLSDDEFNEEKDKILHGKEIKLSSQPPQTDFASGRYIGDYSELPDIIALTRLAISGEAIKVYEDNGMSGLGPIKANFSYSELEALDILHYSDLVAKIGSDHRIIHNKLTLDIATNRYIYLLLTNGEFLLFELRSTNAEAVAKEIKQAYDFYFV